LESNLEECPEKINLDDLDRQTELLSTTFHNVLEKTK
jgi:hypothetical protein